jgi:hypothetical protein
MHAAMAAGPIRTVVHRVRLGEFLAADIAVMIGVDPLEPMLPHLVAAMLAHRPHLVRSDAAVTIGVEAAEHLVGMRDHLLAGDVATGAGTIRSGTVLGARDAGDGKQGRARQ